jgi:hypothetical protein
LKKNIIWIGLAGIVGYFVYSKYMLAKTSNLVFKGIKFSKGKFNLLFKVQNPTNQTGKISSISGSVFIAGKYIADFSNFNEQVINPRSESSILVTATPKLGLASLIFTKGWLKGGAIAKITGKSVIDGISIPFNTTSTIAV